MVDAPQFLQVAKEIDFKAWWLLRWFLPLRVLCFLGTPMNFPQSFTPKRLKTVEGWIK